MQHICFKLISLSCPMIETEAYMPNNVQYILFFKISETFVQSEQTSNISNHFILIKCDLIH